MDFMNMSCLNVISRIQYLNDFERNRILYDNSIRDKFKKELLEECNIGDVYRNFRYVLDILKLDYVLELFDYEIIHNFYKKLRYSDFDDYKDAYKNGDSNRINEIDSKIADSKIKNGNEYKLLVCLCEKNLNKTILWLLSDDNLFKEFFIHADNMYSSFSNLDYELIVKVIGKLDSFNDYFRENGYDFISCIGSENQKALLGENFSDDMIVRLIPYFHTDVKSYFFQSDSRAVYLFKRFGNINSYAADGVKFNEAILSNDNFFDMIKSSSFVQFRYNINAVERYNNPMIIEKKLYKYYDELINSYDYESGMFLDYKDIIDNPELIREYRGNSFIFNGDIKILFMKNRNYNDDGIYFANKDLLIDVLKKESSKKLSEIIIDALFSDNIYNVWLNIREMIRFNDKLPSNSRVLDDEKICFYRKILDFDNVSSEDKITMFRKLRDKNINVVFYDDLRKLKDCSYDMIKSDLLDLSKCTSKIDKDNSDKYGTTIYDLRDIKYTMLVRAQWKYREKGNNRRNCYSIISDENSDTYGHWENTGMVIYGYNSFDNDRVIHALEQDAFSSDMHKTSDGVSMYVNRIATSKEFINGSSWYSEFELVNLKDDEGKYNAKKPDFIVVYEFVRDIDISESKRLDIPIVVIRKTKLKEENRIDMDFDRNRDCYCMTSCYEDEHRKMR